MKTVCNLLVVVPLLLFTYGSATAQNPAQQSDKKVVITKRTVDADGTETIETILKKGKAAENFDVNTYLRENRADNVELDIQVLDQSSEDDERRVVVRSKPSGRAWANDTDKATAATPAAAGSNRGFLGITPREGAKKDAPGVLVNVVKNSAAEKAGLRDGDVLLRLDNTELQKWDNISRFMAQTKPDQAVRVTYLRNGKKNTANVVLGVNKSMAWDFNYKPEDVNVAINTREKEACLGVYSSEYVADNPNGEYQEFKVNGARISDFTKESAAREAQLQAGDVITSINGVSVNGHDQLWEEIAKYQPGDKVVIEFLRDRQTRQVEASLKACRDNANTVTMNKPGPDGTDIQRAFQLLNWADEDREPLRDRQIITIRRSTDGDASQINPTAEQPANTLQLSGFRASPSPTIGQMTVEFRTAPQPVVVLLLDKGGRQLFREELNAFNGEYRQRFDLSDFAKDAVIVQVQQGDRVFTEKVILP